MNNDDKTLYTIKDEPIPWLEPKVEEFLDLTTLIFGATGSGKTTIIDQVMYLTKNFIPNCIVFLGGEPDPGRVCGRFLSSRGRYLLSPPLRMPQTSARTIPRPQTSCQRPAPREDMAAATARQAGPGGPNGGDINNGRSPRRQPGKQAGPRQSLELWQRST